MGRQFRESQFIDFDTGVVRLAPMEFTQKFSGPWTRDTIILHFEARMDVWYFGPAIQVLKAIEGNKSPSAWSHCAYGLLSMTVSYFELIGKSLNASPRKDAKAIQDFRTGFRDVYGAYGLSDDEIDEFWKRLRNGLYHIGSTAGRLIIHNHPPTTEKDFDILWQQDRSGKTDLILDYYYVNPHAMVRTLLNHFPAFVERIKAPQPGYEWVPDRFDEFMLTNYGS